VQKRTRGFDGALDDSLRVVGQVCSSHKIGDEVKSEMVIFYF
jgi:hypothetical protein